MKNKLMKLLKSNNLLYQAYFYLGSAIMSILAIFIPVDRRMILFNSYGGKKYDDSTKAIYEKMLTDERFKDFKFIWAFHDPSMFHPPRATKIRTDGLKYFYYTLRAGCWVTNSAIERGLMYKNKKTFYLNTLHGSPIKKLGKEISKDKNYFYAKLRPKWKVDAICAQCAHDTDAFVSAFGITHEQILNSGLPRNDILATHTPEMKESIRKKLNLPADKKILLYTTTFREYSKDEMLNCIIAPPIDLARWERELGDEYAVIFSAHYEISKVLNIQNNGFIRDYSSHPVYNDLLIVSDIMICDYSSVFFDYAIMGKPMLSFGYDYHEYMQKRGMNFDLRAELPNGMVHTEDDLLEQLKALDFDDASRKTVAFREKHLRYYANASQICIDAIWEKGGYG